MGLTAKQEAFARAIADGKNQTEAYRIAYPVSLKWKPASVVNQASAMMRNPDVLAIVDVLRSELAEKNLWTREESIAVLKKTLEVCERATDYVAVIKELNAMHGFKASEKIDIGGGIDVRIVFDD